MTPSQPTPIAIARPSTPARTRWSRRLRSRLTTSASITSVGGSKARLARSRSCFVSAIRLTCVPLERRSSLRDEDANRRSLDPEEPRGLLGAVIEQVDEDDRGPLPGGEGGEGSDDRLARLDLGELVARRGQSHRATDGERGAPPPLPPQVHRGAEQVARRVVHLGDPVPALPDAEEGLLHDVLGLGAVAGDQAERAVEVRVLGLDQVLERRAPIHRRGIGWGLGDETDCWLVHGYPHEPFRGEDRLCGWARPNATGASRRSRLDPDGVQDRALFLEVLGWRTGGPPGRDHQTGAFDVEDPELLRVAGTRVAVERVPRFRVDGRDPALEARVGASYEEPVVRFALERQGLRHGQHPVHPAVPVDGYVLRRGRHAE